MASECAAPSIHVVPGGVLSLSGAGLRDILAAVLAREACLRFTARGSSMYPFIIDGDVLTVAPLSEERLRLGDIVACCSPESGRLVIHRVVARRRDAVLLRGDNSTGPDGLTGMAAVLGRVARVERQGRELACGRGPERLVIAALSRRGALVPLGCVVRRVVWPVMLRARARDGRRSR